MLAKEVDSVRNDAVYWFSDHWEIGRVLEKLQHWRIDAELVGEEEIGSEPWEASESLNEEAET